MEERTAFRDKVGVFLEDGIFTRREHIVRVICTLPGEGFISGLNSPQPWRRTLDNPAL